jgi:hypothetical protein
VIHGHFLADAFDDLFLDRRLVTWVRHPVDRVVSNYQQFLRSPDMRDDCCRAVQERRLSLREFADLEWMRNMTTRYLANKRVVDFEFIGITECFHESIQLFLRTFGFRVPRGLHAGFPYENVNPDRAAAFSNVSHADRSYILERNRADFAFYNQAAERMAQAVSRKSARIA